MARQRNGDTDGTNKPVRKSDPVAGVDNAEFRGYVNLALSDEQKSAYEAWSQSQAYWEALEGFVSSGVQLSLKRELKQGGYLASATQRDPKSPNAGLVVTARGREATVAFGRVLFCLTILSRHERWEDTQPVANPDRW